MATGRSLAELPAELMICAAYYAMLSAVASLTEEQMKARESFKRVFRNAEYEYETGMPAISQQYGPADADPLPPPPQD